MSVFMIDQEKTTLNGLSTRMMSLLAVVLLAVLVGWSEEHVTVVNGQVPDDAAAAKAFFDSKERDVMAIAANATANNNGCQGLNGCGGSACSLAVCNIPLGSAKSLQQCYTIDNNENFDICSSQACPNMSKLDYNQSFVTLPSPGYLNLQPEVAKDICLQKPLDEGVFKYISWPNNYFNVFFGSVTGAFRAWPGKEVNDSYCSNFDARRRPWYLNGISVQKDVKILVDVSLSMAGPVKSYNPDSGTTYLNVTQNITRALLQTFSPQDFVEIFKFDSSDATSLTVEPVHIDASFHYTISEGPDREELKPLINQVNSLVASQDGASNLTNALINASSSFKQPNYSRVIIVLTVGKFTPVDASYFPTTTLVSSQTKLMIYKLDTGDTDKYLQATSLETAVCSVNGSFEVLDSNALPNPLYAMRSYFTFLAQTQVLAAGNKSTWANKYYSVTQNLQGTTVTYPAFGSDGQLIGVAGVDVFLNDQLLVAELDNRRQGTLSPPSKIPLTCSYQKEDASVQCQSGANDTAICQPYLGKTPLKDITCCGTCSATSKGLSTRAKAGIGVGSILVIALIAGIIYCIYRRRAPSEKNPPPPINNAPLGNGHGDPVDGIVD